jgi:hypothetical protein
MNPRNCLSTQGEICFSIKCHNVAKTFSEIYFSVISSGTMLGLMVRVQWSGSNDQGAGPNGQGPMVRANGQGRAEWSGPNGQGRAEWSGPIGQGPMVRAQWPGPNGQGPMARAQWSGPNGQGPMVRAQWSGPKVKKVLSNVLILEKKKM